MCAYQHGRHEHGQNFLIDLRVVDTVVDLVSQTRGPIVEIGSGDGALTLPLQRLQRPLTAIEIDSGLATGLSNRVESRVQVVASDFLGYHLPRSAFVLVENLPFHQTTAMLRRILRAPGWTEAVLLVQWEVARRRAGVGGATLMTAQWSPWFTFELHGRVSSAAFRPRPSVDGGILVLRRRHDPLLSPGQRAGFQHFVHRVFTGRGRGLADILCRAGAFASVGEAGRWLQTRGVSPGAVAKELSAAQWVDLFCATGTSPPTQPRRARRRR